jgi:hypothetical protein
MATYYPSTPWPAQFVNPDTGELLSGGVLRAFVAGSSTPTTMYRDGIGTSAGTAITLNAGGYPTVSSNIVVIWLDSGVEYKFTLEDALGSGKWSVDNIASAAGGLGSQGIAKTVTDLASASGPLLTNGLRLTSAQVAAIADTGAVIETTWNNTTSKAGGGRYEIKTRAQHRTDIATPAWVPDGVFDHYLLAGTTYVAVLQFTGELWAAQGGWSKYASATVNRQVWQAAIDYQAALGGGVVIVSDSVTINGTVKGARGVVSRGITGYTTITCDFTSWTGLGLYSVPDLTGYYVGTTGGQFFGQGNKQGLRDLIFIGANNSSMVTTGVYIGCADRRDVSVSANNLSCRQGIFQNVDIYKFDTGMNIAEAWESKFHEMTIAFCRRGLAITGQSVNNCFALLNVTVGDRSYTSSVDRMICMHIIQGENYGVGEATVRRPEGNNFVSCKFNDYEDGVVIFGHLALSISDSTIDLHKGNAFLIGAAPGTAITNNYIANGSTDVYATIKVAGGFGEDLSLLISGNKIVNYSSDTTQMALEATSWNGFEYTENNHAGYFSATVCSFVDQMHLTIKNNKFLDNVDDWLLQTCIKITGGEKIIVDGNMSKEDNKILAIHPSDVPSEITIGANEAQNQRTMETGVITIGTGETSDTVDFKHNNTGGGAPGETGLKNLVFVTASLPDADVSVVCNGFASRRATFTQNVLAEPHKIYYHSICVPSTLG